MRPAILQQRNLRLDRCHLCFERRDLLCARPTGVTTDVPDRRTLISALSLSSTPFSLSPHFRTKRLAQIVTGRAFTVTCHDFFVAGHDFLFPFDDFLLNGHDGI